MRGDKRSNIRYILSTLLKQSSKYLEKRKCESKKLRNASASQFYEIIEDMCIQLKKKLDLNHKKSHNSWESIYCNCYQFICDLN